MIHFNFGRSLMPPWLPPAASNKNDLTSFGQRLIRQSYLTYARWLDLRDLPWLKRAGKGIVVTFQGDDARQGDYSLANFDITMATEVEAGYYSAESDRHKRQRIATWARYADQIYALNPDLLHVLPPQAKFLPYGHIDLRDWSPPAPNRSANAVPVVLHAPTHRGGKGTRFVLDAVSRLEAEGIPFQLKLVEGLSHAEARQLYQQADLLIDQLLAGWYGGLAVELMALGKPVICYIRDKDLNFIPPQMRADLPFIRATPATIYEVLKTWLTTRKQEIPAVGQRSRAYVETWHDPLKVAANLQTTYQTIMAEKPGLNN